MPERIYDIDDDDYQSHAIAFVASLCPLTPAPIQIYKPVGPEAARSGTLIRVNRTIGRYQSGGWFENAWYGLNKHKHVNKCWERLDPHRFMYIYLACDWH